MDSSISGAQPVSPEHLLELRDNQEQDGLQERKITKTDLEEDDAQEMDSVLAELGDDLFLTPKPPRERRPRSNNKDLDRPEAGMDLERSQLAEEQVMNGSLKKLWQEVETEDDSHYLVEDGVLHHCGTSSLWEVYTQIVLPTSLREKLFNLPHSSPLTAHLRAKKTKQNILRYFFWPGLCKNLTT